MTFGSTMHEPSVLIVEDESIVAMELAAFVRQLGYRVAATAADFRMARNSRLRVLPWGNRLSSASR